MREKGLIFMIEKIILKLAVSILQRHADWSPEINCVKLQIMSKDFHKWCYGYGYKLFERELAELRAIKARVFETKVCVLCKHSEIGMLSEPCKYCTLDNENWEYDHDATKPQGEE
jgi:hypothetical protein